MGRNVFRSDYAAGEPAWIDWIFFVDLLIISFGTLFTDGRLIVVALSGAAAIGFGTFLTVAELRKFKPLDSNTDG